MIGTITNNIIRENKISSFGMQKNSSRLPLLPPDKVSFSGINNRNQVGMIVMDLDGTFGDLGGTEAKLSEFYKKLGLSGDKIKETISNAISKNVQDLFTHAEKLNMRVVYASARTIEEFYRLREKFAAMGLELPLPHDYIGGNGNFVFKNIEDKLVLDKEYKAALKAKTNFDRGIIYKDLKELGETPEYKLSDAEIAKHPMGEDYKVYDPDFYGSKLTHYNFNASEFFLEFMYHPDVASHVEADIARVLGKNNISYQVTKNKYPEKNIDWLKSMAVEDEKFGDIVSKARPLRIDPKDGGLHTIHLGAAQKIDAVEYLRTKLNNKYLPNTSVPTEEIVLVGDDINDKSLVHFIKKNAKNGKGAYFILPANATQALKDVLFDVMIQLNKLGGVFAASKVIEQSEAAGQSGVLRGLKQHLVNIKQEKIKQQSKIISAMLQGNESNSVERKVLIKFNELKKSNYFNKHSERTEQANFGADWDVLNMMLSKKLDTEVKSTQNIIQLYRETLADLIEEEQAANELKSIRNGLKRVKNQADTIYKTVQKINHFHENVQLRNFGVEPSRKIELTEAEQKIYEKFVSQDSFEQVQKFTDMFIQTAPKRFPKSIIEKESKYRAQDQVLLDLIDKQQ